MDGSRFHLVGTCTCPLFLAGLTRKLACLVPNCVTLNGLLQLKPNVAELPMQPQTFVFIEVGSIWLACYSFHVTATARPPSLIFVMSFWRLLRLPTSILHEKS